MKPAPAYAIASSTFVAGTLTWLIDHPPWTPLVSAGFGDGPLTVGNALRGSTLHMTDTRAPLSTRERWLTGGLGAACVIAFALVLPALMGTRT